MKKGDKRGHAVATTRAMTRPAGERHTQTQAFTATGSEGGREAPMVVSPGSKANSKESEGRQ